MSPRSLQSALRYSRTGFAAARQIVLGIVFCVLLAYGAVHVTHADSLFSDAPATECVEPSPTVPSADAPGGPDAVSG